MGTVFRSFPSSARILRIDNIRFYTAAWLIFRFILVTAVRLFENLRDFAVPHQAEFSQFRALS